MAEGSEESCSGATHSSKQILTPSSRQSSFKLFDVCPWLIDASLYQENMDACMAFRWLLRWHQVLRVTFLLETEKSLVKNNQKLLRHKHF